MPVQAPYGKGAVTRYQRLHNRQVFVDGLADPISGKEVVDSNDSDSLTDPRQDLDQRTVPGGACKSHMKILVLEDEIRISPVGYLNCAPFVAERNEQPFVVPVVDLEGGQLETPPNYIELADRMEVRCRRGEATVREALDETLDVEPHECFADRSPRDAETIRKRDLPKPAAE